MVTFLTLLLELTVGVKPVQLAVDHRVASVELRLDGATVATLTGEPWTASCDFGPALLPHHLEAIARDASGEVLHRALQRVNLPREAAEATLLLIGGADGYQGAELSWKSIDQTDPEEILVFFDGEPLAVDGRRVTLPKYDAKAVHVLAAELRFGRDMQARVEVAFGGEYGEEVRSELTAVPIELRDTRKLPDAAVLEAWLRVDGQPVHVAAVERGPRELLVVREEASLTELRSLGRQAAGTGPRRGGSVQQRMTAGIDVRDTLRLVDTRPQWLRTPEGGWTGVFRVSPNLNTPRTGLGWTLTNLFVRDDKERLEERLNEAVAVAGLHAAGTNRIRAVLLVRAEESADSPSMFEAENVRGFLRALRVPFFYWRLGPPREGADPWGEPTVIRGWGGVHTAVGAMMDVVRPQFLVWVDGLHRPGDVELAADAPPDLRLAGAGVDAAEATHRRR
jgi:hypothetical protein